MTSPNTTTGRNATATGTTFNYIHEVNSPPPLSNLTKEEMLLMRNEYYRVHYRRETGIRIAGTLGGFFLFVLLTLWYKSRCKKHSRDPSPAPVLSQLPATPPPRYGGGSSEGDDDRMAMLDPSHFINMSQIHPYNNHYPLPNNHRYVTSPALLLTAANSESSDEDLSSAGLTSGGLFSGNPPPTIHHLNPVSMSPKRMKWLQQNIDIHVILPTPTISPSGSEHFCSSNRDQEAPLLRRGSGAVDRDRSSSVGSNSYPTGGGGGGGNPLFFLDNLKYVDDTSSENIPTFEDPDVDTRSIGSDSVFAGFEHNFDHVVPGYGRRISNGSGYSGGVCGGRGDEEESDFKLTLTQAQAQVHHRDSFCSEVESINDYLESHRRRSSSTQTTFSDLQQCLSLSCTSGAGGGISPGGGSLTGEYSPHLSPHSGGGGGFKQGMGQLGHRQLPNPGLLSVGGPKGNSGGPMGRVVVNFPRKRSFEGLRKTHSLQCDEPIISCSSSKAMGK